MIHLSLTAADTLISIIILIGIIISVILISKYYIRRDLKHKINKNTIDLDSRTLYSNNTLLHSSKIYFNVGLLLSMSFCLVILNWTTYEKTIFIPFFDPGIEDPMQIPPRTADPPPPLPPPPKEIEEVLDEEIIEEEPEFIDESIEEDTFIEEEIPIANEPEKKKPTPMPAPAEQTLDVEEIISFAEQMPRFPGCEDMAGDNKTKENCAKEKMLQYIYENLNYPAIARENGVEGMVVMQFVVSKEGRIKDIVTLRDIGANCGTQALKVVEAMNNLPQRWTPGKQRGRTVDVRYTLPIRFKLQG